MKVSFRLVLACLVLLTLPRLGATDLTYTTLVPQTGDDPMVIGHKQAVAQGQLAQGNTYAHIATSGTNALVTNSVSTNSVLLDRLVINNPGSAAATLTLVTGTGTNAVTVGVVGAQAAPVTLPYNVRLPAGLSVVATGTNAPDVTVSYR